MIPAESYRTYFEAKKGNRPFGAVVFPRRTGSIKVGLDSQGEPLLEPMQDCTQDGFFIYPFVYPAVRLQSFAGEIIEPFVPEPMPCEVDWGLPGFELGISLQSQNVDQCLGDKLVDTDSTQAGIQAECTVRLVNFVGTEEQEVAVLPPCEGMTESEKEQQGCWSVSPPEDTEPYDPDLLDAGTGLPDLPEDVEWETDPDACPATLTIEPPADVDISQYEAVVAECTYSLL